VHVREEADQVILQAETPEDAELLQSWPRYRPLRVMEVTTLGSAMPQAVLAGGPAPDAPVVAAVERTAQTMVAHGHEWLCGLVALLCDAILGFALAPWLSPAVWLGLALVTFVAVGVLMAALSWYNVRPVPQSRAWFRVGYWIGGVWLLTVAGAVTLGVLLWLGAVLGAVAWRLMPS